MKKSMILAGILMGILFGKTVMAAVPDTFSASVLTEQAEDKEQEVPDQEDNAGVELYIDNQTVYEGMNTSYSNGYIPIEEENSVEIILPLLNRGKILNKEVRVSPNIGDTQGNPFVYKNYDMRIKEEKIQVTGTDEKKSVYYVKLTLELKQERKGGTFPVIWEISGESTGGEKFAQTFTTYVNISEKKEEETTEGEEVPEHGEENEPTDPEGNEMDFQGGQQEESVPQEETEKKKESPKLLHTGTTCDKEEIIPGDSVSLLLQFQNMNEKEDIHNVSLTVLSQEKNISILNESTVWYFESIRRKEVIEIPAKVLIQMGIETDAFTLQYKASYENSEAEPLTEEGTVTVKIRKTPKITPEITKPNKQIYVGDAIAIKGNFMNTGAGKAYNVTVSAKADGLRLQNTLFIGEIESRDAAACDGILLVDGREGKEKYGEINGVYRICYSDESGEEYTEEIPFTTELQPPILLSDTDKKEEGQNMSVQWWVTIGLLAEIILICLVYFIKKVKKTHGK